MAFVCSDRFLCGVGNRLWQPQRVSHHRVAVSGRTVHDRLTTRDAEQPVWSSIGERRLERPLVRVTPIPEEQVPEDVLTVDSLARPIGRVIKILHSYTVTNGESRSADHLLQDDAYVLRRPYEVNYPALLAPSRLAAIGHSLRAGLSCTDIVPRDPVRGRGPASSCRPAVGVGALVMRPTSTDDEDCPADLIPGVLALYPQSGNGSRTHSRSSYPSIGCDTIAPQEPGYSWLLLSRICTGRAVPRNTSPGGFKRVQTRFLPGLLALLAEAGPGAPRYRSLNTYTSQHTRHSQSKSLRPQTRSETPP
jgi:hypothetical protein